MTRHLKIAVVTGMMTDISKVLTVTKREIDALLQTFIFRISQILVP